MISELLEKAKKWKVANPDEMVNLYYDKQFVTDARLAATQLESNKQEINYDPAVHGTLILGNFYLKRYNTPLSFIPYNILLLLKYLGHMNIRVVIIIIEIIAMKFNMRCERCKLIILDVECAK